VGDRTPLAQLPFSLIFFFGILILFIFSELPSTAFNRKFVVPFLAACLKEQLEK
jgi:hypothetical protein